MSEESIVPIFKGIRLANNVTGIVLLSVEGGSTVIESIGSAVKKSLNHENYDKVKNIVEKHVFGPFDLLFTFDVDRLSGYDHELNSLLSIKASDFFSLPCVRLLFDEDRLKNLPQEEESIALIFMKSKDRTVDNYSNIFTFFRSIINGRSVGRPNQEFSRNINNFLQKYRGMLGNSGFFLTYSLFDLLMIVKINDVKSISEFIVELRELLKDQIEDTSTIIGYSRAPARIRDTLTPNQMSNGRIIAEIKIKIQNGKENHVLAQINSILNGKNCQPTFSWLYGDYDLGCCLIVGSLEALHLTVVEEIRGISGVIKTATCFKVSADAKNAIIEVKESPSCPIGEKRLVKDAFREKRDKIFQEITDNKLLGRREYTLFLDRKSRQFKQIEQILYRLRYVGFRWQKYQKYLPSTAVFEQMELTILDLFDDLGNSQFWDELSKLDKKITGIHRIVTSLEKGFYQRLESLDVMLLSSIQAKGIEKLGSFEGVMEAMDAVANDYISISGDNWHGLVVSGIWDEEFKTDIWVDMIYVPTFSKYRMKTWPLIAHEVGHHIDYRIKDKTALEDLYSLVEEYQLLFSDFSGFETDLNIVTGEILSDILATYSAGTSFVQRLVEHLYAPPYYFDPEIQGLSSNKRMVPMPLRILVCTATLELIGSELSGFVEDIRALSEAAISAEELRFKEYIENLESVSKITESMEEIQDVMYRAQIEKTILTYIESARRKVEQVSNSLKPENSQREVGKLVNELLDNLPVFSEISSLYKRQLGIMISDLKISQTTLKQSNDFVSSLRKKRQNGTSILEAITGTLKPSPFYEIKYGKAIDQIRQLLINGMLTTARPALILEAVSADRKNELNENAAIFSILLYKPSSLPPTI
jgi:hypothetical protein